MFDNLDHKRAEFNSNESTTWEYQHGNCISKTNQSQSWISILAKGL